MNLRLQGAKLTQFDQRSCFWRDDHYLFQKNSPFQPSFYLYFEINDLILLTNPKIFKIQ